MTAATVVVGLMSQVSCLVVAEAAVSKGTDKQLEVSGLNQGGGVATSSAFRAQSSVGEGIAGNQISSSRFRIIPGFVGASASTSSTPLVSDLDLNVLSAKTDASVFGVNIPAQTWQRDSDPVFIWEPPPTGPPVVGYSYAIDGALDNVPETTDTSFDVKGSTIKTLTDGKHIFSVLAVNSAGGTGKPVTFELWVDTTPPQLVNYVPAPSALLSTLAPELQITVTDAGSGVTASTVTLSINGLTVPVRFDQATGVMTLKDTTHWKEGINSLTLEIEDAVGNRKPGTIVWSYLLDVTPPAGNFVINGNAQSTTSAYVTLSLSASEKAEGSGVSRVMLSNEELTGYVEEAYAAVRELWMLTPVRGTRTVYAKFVDAAGNVSAPVRDDIYLDLRAPETMITSGPAGSTPNRDATFEFTCSEQQCVFSYAFDNDAWSAWTTTRSVTKLGLPFGNHYFRVRAAKDINGTLGIQDDEIDPSPAERTWVVGVESPILVVPKGPPIKVWRLE